MAEMLGVNHEGDQFRFLIGRLECDRSRIHLTLRTGVNGWAGNDFAVPSAFVVCIRESHADLPRADGGPQATVEEKRRLLGC